jgi:glycosyltransferase involved in cell wall biosynthesis
VVARNEEQNITNCLCSLLDQTFKDYEIIILDDGSTDSTFDKIKKFNNKQIKVLRNKENLGIAKSRNIALKHSSGKYIFFTDADCIVNKKWIQEGLKSLENDCIGVEGKLVYVSEKYKPTFSTKFFDNPKGGLYCTGNVAYRKDLIEKVGGFNEKMNWFRDRDLGLRIAKLGKICFNENMIAVHPKETQTPKGLIKSAKRVESRVYLFKKFGDRASISWRVWNPINLAKIFFPPMILMSLLTNKFITREDYNLLPFSYLFAILERFYIWKASAKYRIFLI